MSTPLVCAIMLTRDRNAMALRAVECWRKQTYASKLIVMDSSPKPIDAHGPHVTILHSANTRMTIGAIRNAAANYACEHLIQKPHVFVHMDDDDWSHSNRIAEQVALLESSGADAVGYNQALFWNVRQLSQKDMYGEGTDEPWDVAEEAWLYTAQPGAQALGASLCYWRSTWERKPFEDKMFGEDLHFQLGLNVEAVSSLVPTDLPMGWEETEDCFSTANHVEPRLICAVHGGNTSTKINPAKKEWKRAEDWDEYCRSTMNHA